MKKNVVLARKGIDLPSKKESGNVRQLVARIPTAKVNANLGSIVQVSLDDKHEQALRTEVDKLPNWSLTDEVTARMPIQQLVKTAKKPATKKKKAPAKKATTQSAKKSTRTARRSP